MSKTDYVKELLNVSDYNKKNDYQYTRENYEELKRINILLKNCVEHDFQYFVLNTIIDHYIFFFKTIDSFSLILQGFKEIKKIIKSDTLYKTKRFEKFIKGLVDNLDKLNENLKSNQLKNIHYYDVAFIADIEQYKIEIKKNKINKNVRKK